KVILVDMRRMLAAALLATSDAAFLLFVLGIASGGRIIAFVTRLEFRGSGRISCRRDTHETSTEADGAFHPEGKLQRGRCWRSSAGWIGQARRQVRNSGDP